MWIEDPYTIDEDVAQKGRATKVSESDKLELVTVELMQLRPLSSHQQLSTFCVICEKFGSKREL